MNRSFYPMVQAVLAAALFGISAPLAKLLLDSIAPIPLAAFLYLGSGFGLLSYLLFQKINPHQHQTKEAEITKIDFPWLIGAIFAGGMAAPIILMYSLRNTPAATASLLLNFEGVATTLIAALIFKEAIGRKIWLAIFFVTAASILLTVDWRGEWGFSLSAFGILGACIFWGIDNNFTRNISAKNPLIITMVKGLGAGSISLILGLILNNPIPGFLTILKAMMLGCFSYGISVVLFIFAMRNLGAARTSAFFGTAPFIGTVLSIVLFHEWPGLPFIGVLLIMVAGVFLLFYENHFHKHIHSFLEHEHCHQHDDKHHQHDHGNQEICNNGQHTHLHIHQNIEHDHAHTPDIHHRHKH